MIKNYFCVNLIYVISYVCNPCASGRLKKVNGDLGSILNKVLAMRYEANRPAKVDQHR